MAKKAAVKETTGAAPRLKSSSLTVQEIFDAVDRLAAFPFAGRVVPEVDDEHTREVIVGNYRVIYDIHEEVVRILGVLHGARLFPKA